MPEEKEDDILDEVIEEGDVEVEDDVYFGSDEAHIKEDIQDLKEKETSQWELVWKRFKRHKLALFGMVIIGLLIFTAIFAPLLAPHDPYETNVGRETSRQPTSWEHPLGTDSLGRDTLSRLMYGSRTALLVGLVVVGIAAGIGVTLGLIAGAFGGWIDEVIMRTVDAFLAFPTLIFGIALAVTLGEGLWPVVVAIGLRAWTSFARVVRGEVLSIREELFIESAEAIGESKFSTITKYFLPNVTPSIIVLVTIQMPTALLAAASLNFLGVGIQPPDPTWGQMVNEGAGFMQFRPTLVTVAGLAIVFTVLAFNFVGDGLRDALDPVRAGG